MNSRPSLRICILFIGLSGVAAAIQSAFVERPTGSMNFGIQLNDVNAFPAVVWIDGRTDPTSTEPHLPSPRIPLQFDTWDTGFVQLIEAWVPPTPIVVFCEGDACDASKSIATRLRSELAFDGVFWLEEGTAAFPH